MEAEKGSTLLAVLVAFLIMIIMLLGVLQVAGMERNMSTNNVNLLQARQAVDGEVARACERTYARLAADSHIKLLPENPVAVSTDWVVIGDSSDGIAYRIVGDGVRLISRDSTSCTYSFGCEANCRGAVQNVLVEVKYSFTESSHDVAGDEEFDSRVFTDHGRIIKYQPLNGESSL